LRSAFLSRSALSPHALVATRCVCACIVDITRLGVYFGAAATAWSSLGAPERLTLIATAAGAALLGSFIGVRLLDKATIGLLRRATGIALMALAVALGAGLLSPAPT